MFTIGTHKPQLGLSRWRGNHSEPHNSIIGGRCSEWISPTDRGLRDVRGIPLNLNEAGIVKRRPNIAGVYLYVPPSCPQIEMADGGTL